MNEETKLRLVYNEAYDFIKNKVKKDILEKQLSHYYECKPKSMKDVFEQMIESLKNKQGYLNFIADKKEMNEILFNFNPKSVFETYGDDWKKLFDKFAEKFESRYKMDKGNKRNAWVMYSKGVLSGAKFLSNFNSVREFDKFVKSFFHNEFTIAALPMLLEKEIFGFGFPLACDFLKELGYVQYAKPDTHLKDIFFELGLAESKSDYEVFKKIVKMGKLVNKDPVIVDKIFWLIGSGDFYESHIKIGRQKAKFIDYMKKKLEE